MERSGAVESMAPFLLEGEERILSIMLSTSELAKLDLSDIQLFPANIDCAHNGLSEDEKGIDPLSHTRQDSFSFCSEAEEGFCTGSVQVLKSRGVIEAEKSMMDENRGNNNGRRKKSVSIDETRLDRFESGRKENQENQENQESQDAAEGKEIKKAQDDSAVQNKSRPLPFPVKNGRAEEERAEAEEITRIKPGIDLKSSPAAKFLVQVMPWELQPSPVTPFTPAAVPFKWEEVPGKPKALHEPSGLLPQTNSFPVLHPPPRLLMPAQAAKKLPAPQSQKPKKSSGSVISSLDYKLPSPWNGDVKPAFSPFRDLGPRDDAVHSLRTKAASALISFWQKFNPKTQKPKPNTVPLVSSYGSEEVLTDREAFWVKVNDSTRRNYSPNSRITMATRGFDDKGFSNKTMICLWEAKDVRPIPDPEYYRNGLKLVEKRPKRKWVMRKLRRPARFFKALFNSVWRAVSLRKSRRSNRGSINLPYESLVR